MKIHVLGLGNVLMGDDAAGPWAVALLDAQWEMAPGVEVLDLGTPGLDLLPYVSGDVDAVILVDTVKASAPPGTLRTYRRDAILRVPPQPRLSPHDPGLKEALLSAELAGQAPAELLLVGIVPERVAMGVGLTDSVRAGLPSTVEAIVDELARLGHAPRRRPVPLSPRAWWEETAPVAPTAAP